MSENITNNEILQAINKGFGELEERIDKRFDGVSKRFDGVDNRLKNLEQGQENIELKLTNVAYRFELQELAGRVGYLEEKFKELNK